MPSKSIKAMVKDINDPDADGGGLWLPHIQRQFVWDEDQIERLFDSIMRQYPLSSMLIWRTRDDIKHRKFVHNHHDKGSLKDYYQVGNKKTKRLVLDGQQRLQSLYLGLKGSIDGRALHFNLLSGDANTHDDIRFEFAFMVADSAEWPWVQLSELVYTSLLPEELMVKLEKQYGAELEGDGKRRATINLSRIFREFSNDSAILFQELDSTSEDSNLQFEDIVEVFIRANSGGTKLSKSDLMFTLLTTEWTDADIEIEDVLDQLNDNDRFSFSRDFLIKLSTTLLGYGAKYDVDKLRDDKVRKDISENWSDIVAALMFVKDEIVTKTYIRSGKALVSYNAVIPLVYAFYHYPGSWKRGSFLKDYLVRTLLAGAFSGQPDGLIDRLVDKIDEDQRFCWKNIAQVIIDYGRNLEMNESRLMNSCGYGSGNIHLLFNLLYGREYKATSMKHAPQIDHIFARSILKGEKVVNEETGRLVQRYSKWEMDQLANCMLLPAHQNGAGDKSDKPLHVWLKDESSDFLDLHCIPSNKRLWKPDRFEDFIDARKKLLLKKLEELALLDEEDV